MPGRLQRGGEWRGRLLAKPGPGEAQFLVASPDGVVRLHQRVRGPRLEVVGGRSRRRASPAAAGLAASAPGHPPAEQDGQADQHYRAPGRDGGLGAAGNARSGRRGRANLPGGRALTGNRWYIHDIRLDPVAWAHVADRSHRARQPPRRGGQGWCGQPREQREHRDSRGRNPSAHRPPRPRSPDTGPTRRSGIAHGGPAGGRGDLPWPRSPRSPRGRDRPRARNGCRGRVSRT